MGRALGRSLVEGPVGRGGGLDLLLGGGIVVLGGKVLLEAVVLLFVVVVIIEDNLLLPLWLHEIIVIVVIVVIGFLLLVMMMARPEHNVEVGPIQGRRALVVLVHGDGLVEIGAVGHDLVVIVVSGFGLHRLAVSVAFCRENTEQRPKLDQCLLGRHRGIGVTLTTIGRRSSSGRGNDDVADGIQQLLVGPRLAPQLLELQPQVDVAAACTIVCAVSIGIVGLGVHARREEGGAQPGTSSQSRRQEGLVGAVAGSCSSSATAVRAEVRQRHGGLLAAAPGYN